MDGAKVVLLLAQHGVMMEDVAISKFLPALTRLLNDTITKRGSVMGSSIPSKKRQKIRDSSPKLLVLQAIHAMLKTLIDEDGSAHQRISSNSHRRLGRSQSRSGQCLDLPGQPPHNNPLIAAWQNQSASKAGSSDHDEKYNEIALDLLSKLRQCLADDTLLVISAKIIRLMLLHKYLSPSNNIHAFSERLSKVAMKITQSLIENFDEDRADYLCQSLFCLSKVTLDNDQAIAFVTEHIQTSLENDIATPHAVPSTSATMLEILGDIFASRSSSLSRESVVSTVDLFVTVFFGENTNFASTCCNVAGREAVKIGGYLLTKSVDHNGGHELNNNAASGALQTSEAKFGIAVRDIVLGIPKYVEQWGSENVEDTIRAIAVLRDVARRCRKDNDECGRMDQLLLSRLRASMEKAWFSPGSKMFEKLASLPEKIQRHIVSLVAIVESPTEITIQTLGTMCGRLRFLNSGHDGANYVASFIVNCIHNIRRTVPMQQYIRFVMDSSGCFALSEILNAEVRDHKTVEWLMKALDNGILDSSACLVQCGTAKVIPMLEQLLIAFLKKIETEISDFTSAVQSRAAIALFAAMSLDTSKYGSNSMSIVSVFDVLPDNFQKVTVNSIRSLLLYTSDQVSGESATRMHWIRPIISLLSTEERLLKLLVDSIVRTFAHSDSRQQTPILQMWLEIFESPKLSSQKLNENLMISCAESVECTLNDDQKKITELIQQALRYA
jgi:hypothetical protein